MFLLSLSVLFSPIFNLLSGLLFALQFFSFLAFCAYCLNEIFHFTKGGRLIKRFSEALVGVLINFGIVKADFEEINPNGFADKVIIKIHFRKQHNLLNLESFH